MKLPSSASAAAPGGGKNTPEPTLDERIAAVQARLKQLRPQLAQVTQDEPAAPMPLGVNADEWAERQQLLRNIEVHYLKHLDTLRALGQLRQSQTELKQEAERWQGFSEVPPHPIELVDGLWNQARAKRREIQLLQVDSGLLANLLEEKRAALKTASQALRQASEQQIAGESVEAVRQRWLRDLAELRLRHAEAVVGALESERELKAASLAYRLGEEDLLRRKAVTAQRMSPLSQEDRDAKLAALAAERRTLRAETEKATAGERKAQEALEAVRARLAEMLQRSPQEDAASRRADLALLEQEVDSRKAEADVASSNLKILRLIDEGNGFQQQMWERRYQLERVKTPQATDEAMAYVQTGLTRLKQFRTYFLSELDLMQRRIDGQQRRLAVWRAEDGDRRHTEHNLRAYQSGEAALVRALAKTDEIEALLGSWQEGMRLDLETVSVGERLRGLYGKLLDVGGRFWYYELVAVEDKIVVEGREIVGKRSVTLGQIAQVLLILVVGLWFAGVVADRGRQIMFRRYPGRESASLLIHRIFSLGAVVGLVVFALVTVNIPLTVFAFVGGALALGVGFGAQNIINNFISGVILLVERPIKINDIVEVDGVRGRVETIGSRCCQVRRFDGIDMLVPNSSFLEKNVTNWTLSDQRLRFTITLGAAYGSAIRTAMELLKQAVREHPKVASDPVAEVYMQNFGESALEFRIDFWLDIQLEPNWQRVVSDVRVRIDELFRESGIVIAFPQRDIHLDAAHPLKVEVIVPPAGKAEYPPVVG